MLFRSPLAFLVPYLIIGYDVLLRAAKNICHGRVFDENFLMMIATFGALAVGEYSEAVHRSQALMGYIAEQRKLDCGSEGANR